MVCTIRQKAEVNSWKNSTSMIDWFKNLNSKEQYNFLFFNVVEFYPSISEDLKQALTFAESIMLITEKDTEIIMHARKSLLFKDGQPWVKREDSNMFDVTMGSFEGAEVCELVGVDLLHQLLEHINPASIGLYHDDGLAVFKSTSGNAAERMGKTITTVFNKLGQRVKFEANLKIVNFLYVTLNLTTGGYAPYRDPNDSPLYIHKQSNHPPSILKQLPTAIGKRISTISVNEEVFKRAAPIYNDALSARGFNEKIQYTEEQPQVKRRRTRNSIWFNPPFSRNIQTNVAGEFLKLNNRHFKTTSLSMIFN